MVRLRYVSWPWVAGLFTLLSLILHAPLLAQFASAVPADLGDPLLNTWILWWNTQQVPFTEAYWNAPIFAPMPDAFALSETLLGLTWLTTPLQWLGASPVVAYNVMFVATPVLNGLSMYWLCLTVTGRRDAALIGGLALAFAPYHAGQVSHLQTRATFFMPIALVGLHRYWSTGERRWALLLAVAFAMNALVCGYFFLYFFVFVGLAVAWLMLSAPDLRKAATVIVALAAALAALSPVVLEYRDVQAALNLRRSINEIERFSAHLGSIGLGSPHLALWPVHTPEYQPELAGYPGLAIGLLVLSAAFLVLRDRRRDLHGARWHTVLTRTLAGLSLAILSAGIVLFLVNRVSYKVFGIAIDLAILAVLCSTRFGALVRSGSSGALYATGAVMASLLALGPVGRVFGHRFWYKPPFAWLMEAPGFTAARTPALFASIEIVCVAVLAALALQRLWPVVTRTSVAWTAVIALAIVIDGWARVPVVAVPRALPVPVHADLVVELPTRGYAEDAAAMYRGMTHGRPVVNGYSGWVPPHYVPLQQDLRTDCVRSLEAVRGGRSMDAVVWRHDPSAPEIDQELHRLWMTAAREETADVIVYRQPRSPSSAVSSCQKLTAGTP